MSLVRPAFTALKLQEERDAEAEKGGKLISVRLNAAELKSLTQLMAYLDIKSEGAGLKLGVEVTIRVLHNTFGAENMKYLFKKERVRMSDYKDRETLTSTKM